MCVVEFSTNVEVKYEAYMKERTEYLEKNKVSLCKLHLLYGVH